MKEPKIIEIAVLLLAVLYATLSWNIHHILDYIITSWKIILHIYIFFFIYMIYIPLKLNPRIHKHLSCRPT